MRIVNHPSLGTVLQAGAATDCLSAAEIALHLNRVNRRVLTALSALQLPAPTGCEFVVTLVYSAKEAEPSGTRRILFSSLWTRFWLVTPQRDPNGRNAVCVADPTWTTLVNLVEQEDGSAKFAEFIKAALKEGAAKHHTLLLEAAKTNRAIAEQDQYLALRLDDAGHGINVIK